MHVRGWLTYRSFLNELLSVLKMYCNVVNQSCSLRFIQNFAPKSRHLRSGNPKQVNTRHKCLFLVNSSQYLLQITLKTFKKSFNFFSGWFFHFKGLFKQVCAKFIGWNFHRWRDDNSPIGGVISDATFDTAYVSHFSRVNLKYDPNPFRQNKVAVRSYWSSFRSLLRTHENSTRSKSKNSCGSTNLRKVIIVGCVITRHVTCHLRYTNKTRYSLLIRIILVLPSAGVMEAIRTRLYPNNINRDSRCNSRFSYLPELKQPSSIAILTLTSSTDMNVSTRSALVLVTKDSFVLLVANLKTKNNVCKQWCLLLKEMNLFHKNRVKTFDITSPFSRWWLH